MMVDTKVKTRLKAILVGGEQDWLKLLHHYVWELDDYAIKPIEDLLARLRYEGVRHGWVQNVVDACFRDDELNSMYDFAFQGTFVEVAAKCASAGSTPLGELKLFASKTFLRMFSAEVSERIHSLQDRQNVGKLAQAPFVDVGEKIHLMLGIDDAIWAVNAIPESFQRRGFQVNRDIRALFGRVGAALDFMAVSLSHSSYVNEKWLQKMPEPDISDKRMVAGCMLADDVLSRLMELSQTMLDFFGRIARDVMGEEFKASNSPVPKQTPFRQYLLAHIDDDAWPFEKVRDALTDCLVKTHQSDRL